MNVQTSREEWGVRRADHRPGWRIRGFSTRARAEAERERLRISGVSGVLVVRLVTAWQAIRDKSETPSAMPLEPGRPWWSTREMSDDGGDASSGADTTPCQSGATGCVDQMPCLDDVSDRAAASPPDESADVPHHAHDTAVEQTISPTSDSSGDRVVEGRSASEKRRHSRRTA